MTGKLKNINIFNIKLPKPYTVMHKMVILVMHVSKGGVAAKAFKDIFEEILVKVGDVNLFVFDNSSDTANVLVDFLKHTNFVAERGDDGFNTTTCYSFEIPIGPAMFELHSKLNGVVVDSNLIVQIKYTIYGSHASQFIES